jgi:hypothetical protein
MSRRLLAFLAWAMMATWSIRAGAQSATFDIACCRAITSLSELTPCQDRQQPPTYLPTFNGCGPETIPYQPSPVIDFVGKFGPADFTVPCDDHDRCYGTCATLTDYTDGAAKADCDTTFLDELLIACQAAYPPSSSLRLHACYDLANAFYNAVKLRGQTPYNNGQVAACYCCDGCDDGGIDAGPP